MPRPLDPTTGARAQPTGGAPGPRRPWRRNAVQPARPDPRVQPRTPPARAAQVPGFPPDGAATDAAGSAARDAGVRSCAGDAAPAPLGQPTQAPAPTPLEGGEPASPAGGPGPARPRPQPPLPPPRRREPPTQAPQGRAPPSPLAAPLRPRRPIPGPRPRRPRPRPPLRSAPASLHRDPQPGAGPAASIPPAFPAGPAPP